ncbi:hypothetical protein AVEN_243709-1 [Araneus ventricosus]|uniref:RNase H type-1 domain-containing protein n=1 Tax=Araneus ventricosus TaxID=182803 RepID=A0A4Y2A7H0_ARAVE|nr:hypothetical protein AVEN_243709-1 [Araneus ventricosus]
MRKRFQRTHEFFGNAFAFSYSDAHHRKEILDLLSILENRDFNILFCRVPSHAEIAGNEQAGRAAKTASSSLQRDLSYYDVKTIFTRRIPSLKQE